MWYLEGKVAGVVLLKVDFGQSVNVPQTSQSLKEPSPSSITVIFPILPISSSISPRSLPPHTIDSWLARAEGRLFKSLKREHRNGSLEPMYSPIPFYISRR